MGVQMNIKSAEAVGLAREISELTGETLTQAVVEALKQRKFALTKDERMGRIRAIMEGSRMYWTDEERDADHTAFLYDEFGLPK